jgi:hypothetical protein
LKKIIIVCSIAILILTIIYFAFYDSKYAFFEEIKADRIADYIILVLYSLTLLFFIVTGIYISVKKNRFNPKEFLKEIIITTIWFALFHLIFLRAVLSGVILCLNDNIGEQKEININGKIISKLYIAGRGSTRELTILTQSKIEYLFDTAYDEIQKYEVNNEFNQKMKIGYFGLVYK